MKRIVSTALFFFLSLGFSPLFPVNMILFKKTESIDLLEKMENNNFFMKSIMGVDADENNIYFLDHRLGTVFRVDKNTAKLVNTIGSKGQGPGELQAGMSIRVINNMVFVSDVDFSGIKIFTPEGKTIKEFKTITRSKCIDVNKKNEIFIIGVSPEGFPNITVYNMDGKKIREFVKFPFKNTGSPSYILNSEMEFRIDKDENMVIVFVLKKLIWKYTSKGELLWEKEIKNEILDKYNTDPKFDTRKPGAVYYYQSILSLDIDENNNIIVGHVYGGVIYDKNGNIIDLIQFDPPSNLGHFRIFDGKILVIGALGSSINVYKYNIK
ncbi:MAG TPA: hypothetical protein VK469_12365 [Candidatus Kapabacteria bacterium]|nr:hypothetical protein [Candidatus Kapabacteria bacterium]